MALGTELTISVWCETGAEMAKNTGQNFRKGSVTGKSQVLNPKTGLFTKRAETGKFQSVKKTGGPFKGVAKERDGRRG